jgi:phosphoribosylformimino-5-aminoimidazole carboxamide ribotide isomerase
MIIVPAIDLKDGKCVRLRQGNMDTSTVFNEDPSAQARMELSSRIHVGTWIPVGGKPANLPQTGTERCALCPSRRRDQNDNTIQA